MCIMAAGDVKAITTVMVGGFVRIAWFSVSYHNIQTNLSSMRRLGRAKNTNCIAMYHVLTDNFIVCESNSKTSK